MRVCPTEFVLPGGRLILEWPNENPCSIADPQNNLDDPVARWLHHTCKSGASMKKILVLFTIGLTLLPSLTPGAQSAKARLFCLSPRFQRGAANDMNGFRWTMELTTLDFGLNGELAPDFVTGGYSNGAWLELYSELLDDTFQGIMGLDTPDFADANGNGLDDFYEVSQAVPSRPAVGAYSLTGFGNGNFTATWYRESGQAVGACMYTIPSPFGGNLSFHHQVELIEYKGVLSYTPGSNTVTASLSLTNTNSMNTLEGPATFMKAATNGFNRLTLQSAFLTNDFQQVLDLFLPTTFLRSTSHRTNYVGDVELNDGDLNTPEEDYYTWQLSIDDLNDSDGDGIPDFSDDPAGVTPPRRPQLSLARSPSNLLLSISGDMGRLHHILEKADLATGNWVTNFSLTLTNDPQVISLPLPPAGARFWRALAQ
jgi:hypothetical protein